ncbi:MAG: OmpH family outer membrane protein [Rhodovibrionaceae bacterium]
MRYLASTARGLLAAFLAPALLAALLTQGAAAEPPQPKIVIIDMQEILRDSTAVGKLQDRIETQRLAYQEELRLREDELRENEQQLVRQRSALEPEDFARRRQELEQTVSEAQRDIQQNRQRLDRAFSEGMRQVQLQVIRIADQIADERGANLVLEKSTVLLSHPDFEITEETLQRLNQSLPTLDLEELAPEAEAPGD